MARLIVIHVDPDNSVSAVSKSRPTPPETSQRHLLSTLPPRDQFVERPISNAKSRPSFAARPISAPTLPISETTKSSVPGISTAPPSVNTEVPASEDPDYRAYILRQVSFLSRQKARRRSSITSAQEPVRLLQSPVSAFPTLPSMFFYYHHHICNLPLPRFRQKRQNVLLAYQKPCLSGWRTISIDRCRKVFIVTTGLVRLSQVLLYTTSLFVFKEMRLRLLSILPIFPTGHPQSLACVCQRLYFTTLDPWSTGSSLLSKLSRRFLLFGTLTTGRM